MCQICTLLDNTWPGPKNLARALLESDLPLSHVNEILDRVTKDLDENESKALASEMVLEILRIS